jgi:hypothetical protein
MGRSRRLRREQRQKQAGAESSLAVRSDRQCPKCSSRDKRMPGIIEITNGDVLFCMNDWHQDVEASRANASLTADQLAELKERSNA